MDELSARRVVLAQAVETVDRQGKLLSEVERGLIDQQARQAARAGGAGPVAPEHFLDLRAQRVLQVAGDRQRTIAALQAAPAWPSWLMAAAPVATLLLGALTERIADPHRVDLLSGPLLAIVLWNLLVYAALLVGAVMPPRAREGPFTAFRGRWAGVARAWRRQNPLGAEVARLFYSRWHAAAGPLQLQRWKTVLHLAALGWAAGVAVSLLVQGLVVQYRVGWESTFLDARQVHAILHVLLLPVMGLFPFEPFTVQQIARLELGPGDAAQFDPRWVWMYTALLLVVVIVPRAVLASVAFARARVMRGRMALDLRDPYFQRIISLLSPARVQLCVLTHRAADRDALLRVLAQDHDVKGELISSTAGDVLRWVEVAATQAPPPERAVATSTGWWHRLRRAWGASGNADARSAPDSLPAEVRDETDVVLHVVGDTSDLDTGQGWVQWLGKPVLILVNQSEVTDPALPGLAARCQSRARELPRVADVLPFDSFARCWVQEGALLDAIRPCLPQPKQPGFDRIASAWHDRNRQRFERSMAAVAEHLLFAARQVEELPSGALSMTSLVVAQQRQAQAQARQAAVAAIVSRLAESAARMLSALRSIHGLDEAPADQVEERLDEKFVVNQAVDTPQAGMAGAATGAAMGASVDLLAGGLTLGAAAALGALVGAGVATLGAAWKNRATPSGATAVQLSDEMMQALVEAALLRYLAVVHARGAPADAGGVLAAWKSDVVAAVEAHGAWLMPFWAAARTQPGSVQAAALSLEVETVAARLLEMLYPPRAPVKVTL